MLRERALLNGLFEEASLEHLRGILFGIFAIVKALDVREKPVDCVRTNEGVRDGYFEPQAVSDLQTCNKLLGRVGKRTPTAAETEESESGDSSVCRAVLPEPGLCIALTMTSMVVLVVSGSFAMGIYSVSEQSESVKVKFINGAIRADSLSVSA